MNNAQLQEAIDKAREFMNLTSSQGGLLHQSREHTKIALKELEKIQVIRAGLMTSPKGLMGEKL